LGSTALESKVKWIVSIFQ